MQWNFFAAGKDRIHAHAVVRDASDIEFEVVDLLASHCSIMSHLVSPVCQSISFRRAWTDADRPAGGRSGCIREKMFPLAPMIPIRIWFSADAGSRAIAASFA